MTNFISRQVKKIVGLEYVSEAVEDAKINSKLNKITNTVFQEGDIAKIFNENFLEEQGMPDVIITDPPRAGMHKDVIASILKTSARRIVYVSCNPATQARDIELLQNGYRLAKSQAVDMFPHTHHIENIVVLNRV
jgi:23S rRNA (uracil1939-C5)-methyltransferase